MEHTPKFIDLFCGVGGIRLAMQQQSSQCVFSCDINPECQKTYKTNFNHTPLGDITQIDASSIPDHDILCGGFPCQPFSISGLQKGFQDTRGTLFFDICRIISQKQPKVILLENVKHLLHHDNGNTLKIILQTLSSLSYHVSYKILNASQFNIPQNRERIIIVASKTHHFVFPTPQPITQPSILNILDDALYPNVQHNHKYLSQSEYTLIDYPKQQQSGLIFAGYLNKNIRKTGVNPDALHLSRTHKQPNRIYSSLGIHPTLSSQETSGRYFILTPNNQVRKLTINECWRLMGFPETFIKPSSISEQYKQLGNSVCIPMISAIAREIKNQFF